MQQTLFLSLFWVFVASTANGCGWVSNQTTSTTQSPAWRKLTAVQWSKIVKEAYGPPNLWSAEELFPVYVAHCLATFPARYAPPPVGRLYNGVKVEFVGKLGAVKVLVDARDYKGPLSACRQQELKDAIHWLSENKGQASHSTLLVVTPQLLPLRKAEPAPTESPLLPSNSATGIVAFSKAKGRQVFVFQATAEYLECDGRYYFRLGPAENLTGDLATNSGDALIPRAPLRKGRPTPEYGVLVSKDTVVAPGKAVKPSPTKE